MDLQIDDFYKDAAGGLLMLYQAFPRKLALYVEDLIGREEPDEFGLPSKRHQACLGALLWLAEEGYLRYVDTIRQEAVDQAVLTGRSFTVLSMPLPGFLPDAGRQLPESLRLEQQTHIHRLEQAVAARSSTDIRVAVLDVMAAMQGMNRACTAPADQG